MKLVEYGLKGLTIVEIEADFIKKVGDENYDKVQKM